MKSSHLLPLLVIISMSACASMEEALEEVATGAYVEAEGINRGLVTYYPLDGNAEDASGRGNTGVVEGAESVQGRFGGAYRFDAGDALYTAEKRHGPDAFSISMWFQAESGGKLIGFESSRQGNSRYYDRHIYMGNDGSLHFGVWMNGRGHAISTSESYVDGEWHHVVVTLSGQGMFLYVDGDLTAHDPAITAGHPNEGYWRIGSGALRYWPHAPASPFFSGTIDEVRIYDRALDHATIRALYSHRP